MFSDREGCFERVLTSFLLFLQCPYALASEEMDGRSLKKCFIQLFLSKYCQGILTGYGVTLLGTRHPVVRG